MSIHQSKTKLFIKIFSLVLGLAMVVTLGYLGFTNFNNNPSNTASAAPVQSLVSFGSNAYGLLGNGQDSNIYTPSTVSNVSNITQSAVGSKHTLALRNDGKILAWGHNGYAQLGQGTANPRLTSVIVKDSTNNDFYGVTQVAAAGYYSTALKSDGTVWWWGATPLGQVNTPTQVTGLPSIRKIITNGSSMYAISNSNELWAWGSNYAGRLGIGLPSSHTQTTPIAVAGMTNVRDFSITNGDQGGAVSGYDVPVLVKNDNTVWAWGAASLTTGLINCIGPDLQYVVLPAAFPYCLRPYQVRNNADGSGYLQNVNKVQAIIAFNGIFPISLMFLGNDGRVYYDGLPTAPQPITSLDGLGITDLYASSGANFFRSNIGNVYVFGSNEYGRIGQGNPNTVGFSIGYPVQQLIGVGNIINIAAGTSYTMLVSNTGSVLGFGDNGMGQIGVNSASQDSLLPQEINSPNLPASSIVDIQASNLQTYLLKNDGTVWAFGVGTSGRLGNGTNISSTTPVQVSGLTNVTKISSNASAGHALALKNDGTVWAWGAGYYGQLGNGSNSESNVPVQVTDTSTNPITNVVDIEAGYLSSGVIKNDGSAWTWGYNQNGLLGIGPLGNQTRATQVTAISNVTKLGITRTHAIFISGGNVYQSGTYDFVGGQLTYNIPTLKPGNPAQVTDVQCGEHSNTSYCQLLFANGGIGEVSETGLNVSAYGAPINSGVTQIEGGPGKIMFLKTDGVLRGAYIGTNGQLGNNNNVDDGTYTASPLNLSNATVFDQGNYTSYAVGFLTPPLDPNNLGQLQGITYSCNDAEVSNTTTCTMVLPSNTSLPVDFKMGINDAIPGGSCSQNSFNFSQPIIVTCLAVPTGTQTGFQRIYGQIGTNTKFDTGEFVTINPTVVATANIAPSTGVCTPNTVILGDNTADCIFPLIGSTVFALPSQGLYAGITNTTGNGATLIDNSDACTIAGTNLVCNNIKTVSGVNSATLGAREVIIHQPGITYFIGKGTLTVSTNITIIAPTNVVTANDCINAFSVTIGNTFTCTFPLNAGATNNYSLPATPSTTASTFTATGVSNPCTVKNNGQPSVALECTNIPTTSGTAGVQNVNLSIAGGSVIDKGDVNLLAPFTSTQIPTGTTLNCNTAPTNSTTSCTITLTGSNVSIPNGFVLGIGDSIPAGTCSLTGNTGTCSNVPTGSQAGSQIVFAKAGIDPKIDTGERALITKILDNTDIPTLGSISNISCSPTPAPINGVVTCTGSVPSYLIPPTGDIKVNIEGQSQITCIFSGQTYTCANVPTGGNSGVKKIFIALSANPAVDSGKTITIADKIITNTDLASIGTNTANDSFISLICDNDNIVTVSTITSCIGTLKDGWSIPNYLKLGINVNPTGNCTQSGRLVVCSNIPVSSTPGDNLPIKAQITTNLAKNSSLFAVDVNADSSIVNTGFKAKVVAESSAVTATTLPRTGGQTLAAILIGIFVLVAGTTIYIIVNHREKMKTN
jgi:alpha-tubulin suppressor-like RCC1 family protein